MKLFLARQKLGLLTAFILICCALSEPIYASTTAMPWDDPLIAVSKSIQGPVAKVLGALALFGLGIGLAFSEGGGSQKKALWLIFGLSIAFNATSWGLSFFGFAGGAVV